MKLKMLVGLAGNEYALGPGDEREFSVGEGARLIDAGYAVAVQAEPAADRRVKRGKSDVVSADGDGAAGE